METTTNSSEDRNAVKVATYASAIVLVGAATIKTKQFVSNRLESRRARRHRPLDVK